MKLIVKTKGSFSLIDSRHGQEIPKLRPVVVVHTAKVADFIKRKQLEKVCEVPDAATDAELVEYLKSAEGDVDLAISAYISFLNGEAPEGAEAGEGAEKNNGKGKGKGKKADA